MDDRVRGGLALALSVALSFWSAQAWSFVGPFVGSAALYGNALSVAGTPALLHQVDYYVGSPDPEPISKAASLTPAQKRVMDERTVMVTYTDSNGRMWAGTGVIVGARCDYVLTAAHIAYEAGGYRNGIGKIGGIGVYKDTNFRDEIPTAGDMVFSKSPLKVAIVSRNGRYVNSYPENNKDLDLVRLRRPGISPCLDDMDVIANGDKGIDGAGGRKSYMVGFNHYELDTLAKKELSVGSIYGNSQPGDLLQGMTGIILSDASSRVGSSGGPVFVIRNNRVALIAIQSANIGHGGVDSDPYSPADGNVKFSPKTNADVVVAIWGKMKTWLSDYAHVTFIHPE